MRAAFLLMAGALVITGCQKGPPAEDQAPLENVENIDDAVPVENMTMPPVPNATNTANAANAVAPPPKVSDDVQTRDDADATGLTARLPENETMLPGQADNQTRPAD